jgi:hypothetical protein
MRHRTPTHSLVALRKQINFFCISHTAPPAEINHLRIPAPVCALHFCSSAGIIFGSVMRTHARNSASYEINHSISNSLNECFKFLSFVANFHAFPEFNIDCCFV